MKRTRLGGFSLIFVLVWCIGCNSAEQKVSNQLIVVDPPMISPISSPVPTPKQAAFSSPISPPTTPTFTPTLEPSMTGNPISEFPLNVGDTWIYSATYYISPTIYIDRIRSMPDVEIPPFVSSAYSETVTVVNTQVSSPYFIAEMRRESQRLGGNLSEDEYGPSYQTSPSHYWYIISGNDVYQEPEINLSENEDKWYLKFKFPLSNKIERWYPEPDARAFFAEQGGCPNWGCTYVEGPFTLAVTAGYFEGCYNFSETRLATNFSHWICPDVGIVSRELEIGPIGTQQGKEPYGLTYGYKEELVKYSVQRK